MLVLFGRLQHGDLLDDDCLLLLELLILCTESCHQYRLDANDRSAHHVPMTTGQAGSRGTCNILQVQQLKVHSLHPAHLCLCGSLPGSAAVCPCCAAKALRSLASCWGWPQTPAQPDSAPMSGSPRPKHGAWGTLFCSLICMCISTQICREIQQAGSGMIES